MEQKNMRADVALVKRGLAPSRERAQALIASRLALVNGKILQKSSVPVSDADQLTVRGAEHPYVSRGGLKLEKALRVFGTDVHGAVAMDIGASTGGFTDVLLQNGAKKVYAIDVGFGQLDSHLAADPRVVSMEHVNARTLEADMFPEKPNLAVMDVSFISIRLILPAAFAVLGGDGRMLTLIKPQFEAGRNRVGKHGIVCKRETHEAVLREISDFVPRLGWHIQALDYSPISGCDGNIEFLADLMPGYDPASALTDAAIRELVRRAHEGVSVE